MPPGLPDPWTGDVTPVHSAVHAARGHPDLEEEALDWLGRRAPSEWARLDELERGWPRRVRPSPAGSSTLTWGWTSFSADGHAREAAVAALAGDPHPIAVAFLIVRCDDWVPSVRSRARAAVLARAVDSTLDLARWMPLLLARDERTRAGGLVEACAAAHPDDVQEAFLRHPDRSTRRWAAARVLRETTETKRLVRLIRDTGDAPVARMLARKLIELGSDAELRPLLSDRRVSVRRLAWTEVAQGRLPGTELRDGLLDRSASVRSPAQQAARLRGVDASALYRSLPAGTPSERRRRIVTLGEWNAADAVDEARRGLHDEDLTVRAASIDVLSLRVDRPHALLLELLRRMRGAELRAVLHGIQRHRVAVPDNALAALRAGDTEQRWSAWRIGRHAGRWERLLSDLLATRDPDDALARAAMVDLATWCNGFVYHAGSPPPTQRVPLEEALAAARIPEHQRHLLQFVLRT